MKTPRVLEPALTTSAGARTRTLTHAHTHAHTPMHTHSQGLSPESFWPVILATALAVWQAPGKDGEKHQGLAPNFAILGVQVEMYLQCPH